MKIALCYSMHFAEKAKAIRDWFVERGHEACLPLSNESFIGLNDDEKEKLKLKQKYEEDAIREHWDVIRECDAILVLNYAKHGIEGYIGGNVFLEMGFAYVLEKPIFLFMPIPKMPHYETELIAMKPVVLDGNLEKMCLVI